MFHPSASSPAPKGQIIVVVALSLTLFLFAVGLAVDGGNGLAQRRASQNASDFAALAGARIMAEHVDGDTVNATDANVVAAINNAISANGGAALTYAAPDGPQYVSANGTLLGYVGTGTIPGPACATDATNCATGVKVHSTRDFKPFFLGVFGIGQWTAAADATAKGGYSSAPPPPGTLFPVGISLAFFQTYPSCAGKVSTDPNDDCYPQHLTPGNLNVPGGFGWLKFGCDGYGLGQEPPANDGGCSNSKPFLQEEIGPPSNSYGCCTQVGVDPDPMHNRIGSLPGNKASADCSYYIEHEVPVTVPIWDYAGGTGQNGWYHIVGFAGFQITGCSGGKDIEGVWRKAFFTGPVSATPAGGSGVPQNLGVQLVQ